MPTFACPHCSRPLEVATSRAGGEVLCPHCDRRVAVPKLGELRQLESAAAQAAAGVAPAETSVARRIAFVTLLGIAAVAGLIGAFCIVRYAAITVPETTEGHIAHLQELYPQLPGGQLVREWQDLERFTPALAAPYQYQQIADEKSNWLWQGLTALGVTLVCALLAIVLVARRPSRLPTAAAG